MINRKSYSRSEVFESTLAYFGGDKLATDVWIDKYCLKEGSKYYELTPDCMHKRMASEFARIESNYQNPLSEEEIYNLFKDFKYVVPQGSPMAGIGNTIVTTSISNCFVIGGQPDSYGGIMNLDEEGAQLMKRRGGVGNTMEFLRPSESEANSAPLGVNAGLPLYMDRFSNTTREVQQDGRRGARMLSIHVKHPDAEKFIDKKMTEGAVTGANVSVKLTEEFLEACKRDEDFYQVFPIDSKIEDVVGTSDVKAHMDSIPYDELKRGVNLPSGVKTYYKKVSATKIHAKLVYNAWKSAEPGALFWDRIEKESPARGYGEKWKELSTNPCGEIPLPAYDSCRLLVLNLASYVKDPYTEHSSLDDVLLWKHAKKAQKLMDDIVDIEIEKINAILDSIKRKNFDSKYTEVERNLWEKILDMAIQGRRTGLGITAEGDMLAALGIKYGTRDATEYLEKLHKLIASSAYISSIDMAKDRGSFPIWDITKDQKSDFINRMFDSTNYYIPDQYHEMYQKYGRRNIALLTVAPTGSVSILTQTTSGIEPLFSAWYFRKKKITVEDYWDYVDEVGDKWVEFPVFHKPFITWYSVFTDQSFGDAEVELSKFKQEELTEIFRESPYFGATAQDVDYIEKVVMQGAVQKWVDHSISVTVNMPEHVTVDVVAEVYKAAAESGCKGVTVYRDNSRGNVLSTTSIKDAKPSEDNFDYMSALKRPEGLPCDIYFKTNTGDPFIILVGLMNDKPYEIFAFPNNSNTRFSKSIKKGEIVKRKKGEYDLISESGDILVQNITSYMIETERNSTRNFSAMLRHRMDPLYICQLIDAYATISAFDKVIGKVLHGYISEEKRVNNPCPVDGCGGSLVMTEGCMTCPSCGHAVCG